jgi:LysM repeat protein
VKRKGLAIALVALVVGCALLAPAALAETTQQHTVGSGDNLTKLAARYGVTVKAIVEANGLRNPNFIWVGQRLVIPLPEVPKQEVDSPTEANPEPEPTVEVLRSIEEPADERVAAEAADADDSAADLDTAGADSEPVVHVVAQGEYLSQIARRYGISVAAIARANGLANPSLIYPGQELAIPDSEEAVEAMAGVLPAPSPDVGEGIEGKWIEIDLTHSTVTAWQGAIPMRTLLVSLGLPWTPTPPGRFSILSKYPIVDMSGPGYYVPGVPHTMFFYKGYAIHGAYWHFNWGQPMSHGCVNLGLGDAAWIYNWTPLGTPVISHW